MNSLSWLIYLADVVGTARGLMLTILILGSIMFFVALAIRLFDHGNGIVWSWDSREALQQRAKERRAIAATVLTHTGRALIGAAIFISFVPGKTTIYAIAASEMGEAALTTQTGGKAVQALNAWLDRQIAGNPQPEPQQ